MSLLPVLVVILNLAAVPVGGTHAALGHVSLSLSSGTFTRAGMKRHERGQLIVAGMPVSVM